MIFPATTNGGGMCMIFPDVCKTPTPGGPVPIPYPNIAQCTNFKGSSLAKKVLICNKKSATVKSEISRSSGDEAGTVGGIISSKNMSTAQVKMGSSKVKFQGKKAARLLSVYGQNGGSNANVPPGMQVQPSQTKVKVSP